MRNELAYFTESVNDLIEGKLILVDKHIASVLKCVATVPALCKCLADSVRATSYVTEFSRARVTWTRPDGTVEARLKLPADRNRLFAFVVCLLTEVDSGRRNFLDFLKEYYDDTDTNIAYEKFATEVLKPFKQAGENILHTVDPASLNMERTIAAERFFAAEKIYVPSEVAEQLLLQTEEVQAIFKTKIECAPHREAALVACDYFSNAIYLKNPKILAICWLGLKTLLEIYPLAKNNLAAMSALMAQVAL